MLTAHLESVSSRNSISSTPLSRANTFQCTKVNECYCARVYVSFCFFSMYIRKEAFHLLYMLAITLNMLQFIKRVYLLQHINLKPNPDCQRSL